MDRVRKRIGLDNVNDNRCLQSSVTIAVLDSGIAKHPDLEGKCILFKDFINDRTLPYDDCGHGTHVCGMICGSGELSGGKYRGIIPTARLVVGKVLDEKGNGGADAMLQALEWILMNQKRYDIRIVNISVGIGALKDRRKKELLKNGLEKLWDAGILVVCAAGNKGPAENSISAIGDSFKVITVGCFDDMEQVDASKNCALYSSRGMMNADVRKPDIVAPGTEVAACNSFWKKAEAGYREAYTVQSGTSMSTPVVAGCAGLLMQREPYLSNEQIKERIKYSAEDLNLPWNLQGWGMICAKRLLEIK